MASFTLVDDNRIRIDVNDHEYERFAVGFATVDEVARDHEQAMSKVALIWVDEHGGKRHERT